VRLATAGSLRLNANLQRLSQWFGRYSGVLRLNYNDEMFFNNVSFTDSSPADGAWLDAEAAKLPGRPKADLYRAGLTHMYSAFDRAVRQVRPDLARTGNAYVGSTPPVEGSYAPAVYEHLTEVGTRTT